ncbi:MAG: aminotransferase class III-fold pyridoxal phosphate-dependent enzyme [Phycisphaerales bacterium]|nr:aminotransferase class III-fold pyridoxal phosphate-dependent enzyme [Phycisphaerales bacterium]
MGNDAKQLLKDLGRHQLVDGYPLVVDLDRCHGSWIHDRVNDCEFLDVFTCFASWPLGYNHPKFKDPEIAEAMARASLSKVANSDIYSEDLCEFVDAFATHVTPPGFPHHFWVSGGSLAVENAMKTAFDWKARKLGRTDFHDSVNDLTILHFKQAFHGRSGYTMSVTNTLPDKVGLFPKFDWPRVHNPTIHYNLDGTISNDIAAEEARACAEIEAAFELASANGTHIAAILIEPMQGEGGDNHFRTEFLQALRNYADEREALLLFDEVQTGFFGSGKPWFWQRQGVAPDIVSFGKKTQVCGIYASNRINEVEENVFERSSRINSTWGGNLVDMVRCRKFIEIIVEEKLGEHITRIGEHVMSGLRSIASDTNAFKSVRGCGSLIAFTFDPAEARREMIAALFDRRVIALPCGEDSVRFRLPLNFTLEEADELLSRVESCVPLVTRI